MSKFEASEIYYPFMWLQTIADNLLSLIVSSPRKTKRSLPEEAECGTIEGIKCWLKEGSTKIRVLMF